MSYLQEKSLIETFFKANWTFTPIEFENGLASNEVLEWVRLSIVSGAARQITLGNNPDFRVNGVVYVQIHIRKDIGSGRAVQLADKVDQLFRNLDLSGIRFMVPQILRNPVPGEWFQINVSTEFYRGF